MRRTTCLVALAAVALLVSGCFDIEQSVDLKKDLSGTADFKLGINFEPMITIMAKMQKEMSGDKKPLTAAEINAAKADFKKNAKRSSSTTDDPKKAPPELPPGVKLLDTNVQESDFAVTTNMKFAFDKLSSLVGVKLPKSGDKGDPTKKSVIESPFKGLEMTETPTTITISTKPQNPAEAVKSETAGQAPEMDADTKKLMADAFKGLKVVWRITAPFDVVSSNATRTEGKTLIWEYDIDRLQKMAATPGALDKEAVKVVYRK